MKRILEENKKKVFNITLAIVIISVIVGITFIFTKEDAIQVSTTTTLSNEKIEWGVKREKDHKQPELGSKNINLMKKYDGVAMGNSEKNIVYLTFDNGYEAGYTASILDTLKANDVKAAFFITAHYLNSQPDLVKRMVEEGHIVGNHTVNHHSMPSLTDEEIKKEIMDLHHSVLELTGYEMKYMRPPKGEYSERTLSLSNSLGYTTVMWSLAYDDWDENKQGREEYGKTKILENIHPGAVILLHGTSKDNMNILDTCIKEIKNMGYEIKSIDEFVR